MPKNEGIAKHRAGDAFDRAGYDHGELTAYVRLIHAKNPVNFTRRVLHRAEDLGLNFNEMAFIYLTNPDSEVE